MPNFGAHVQSVKDFVKRVAVDVARKSGRLHTAMDSLIGILKAYGYLPPTLEALELFGMHGLWHTKDYAPLCQYLEFYEINSSYAFYARKHLKRATVVIDDCIRATQRRTLLKSAYNFIVCDNPYSPFGNNYCEHFDLFPHILNYIDEGVIALNILYKIEPLRLSSWQMERRECFYGTAKPTVHRAVDVYKKLAEQNGREMRDWVFVPRTDGIGYLALVLRRIKVHSIH